MGVKWALSFYLSSAGCTASLQWRYYYLGRHIAWRWMDGWNYVADMIMAERDVMLSVARDFPLLDEDEHHE